MLHSFSIIPTINVTEVLRNLPRNLVDLEERTRIARIVADAVCEVANLSENSDIRYVFPDVYKILNLPFDSPKYLLLDAKFSDFEYLPEFPGEYFTDQWLLNRLQSTSFPVKDFVRGCCVVGQSSVRLYICDNTPERLAVHFGLVAELYYSAPDERSEDSRQGSTPSMEALIQAISELALRGYYSSGSLH